MSNPALPSPPAQPQNDQWREPGTGSESGKPLGEVDLRQPAVGLRDDNDRVWMPFDTGSDVEIEAANEHGPVEVIDEELTELLPTTASVVIATAMDWQTAVTLYTHLPTATNNSDQISWSVLGPERWENGQRPQAGQISIFAARADAIGAWTTQQALSNQDLTPGTTIVAQMDGIRHPRIPRGVRQTFKQASAMHPVIYLPAEPRWRYEPDAKPGKRWRQQLNLIAEHIHTQLGERADSSTEVEPTPEPLIDKGQPS